MAGTTIPGHHSQAIIISGGAGSARFLRYDVHARGLGWQGTYGGYTAGTTGESRPLEAILTWMLDVRFAPVTDGGVCYKVYVSNVGWTPEACDGADAGEIGRDIQAIRIRYVGRW